MSDRIFTAFIILATLFCIAFAVLIAFVAMTTPSNAHEAPAGWAYSWECCSGNDCRPLATAVTATAAGWLIAETGETIPYGDKRIKQSQDDLFHRCHLPTGMTRCLYAPPQAY